MKINVGGLLVLAGISLFIGFVIISVAVGAVFPSMHKLTAPLICKGEVEVEVITYSYKPGQIGTDNHIYCIDEEGRREITWAAIGVSGLVYSAIIFVPLVISGRKIATLPANFGERDRDLKRSRKEGSAMERLAELKKMRDADLISQAEYENKKKKIMDDLEDMTNSPIRIGVLGAAAIVPSALTGPAQRVPEVQVTALAARDPKRAEAFARKHRIPTVHKTYDDLLADPQIDAIYNPLPNGLHAEWTIKALRAGKHVLCEKPFSSNAKEAEEMAAAARETGKVLSEAFAYRYHPLATHMKNVVSNVELGKIKSIEARFCFLLPAPSNIRYNYELAGGALMDAGCYPLSLVRFLTGLEPTVTSAKAKLYKPQVDSRMEADLDLGDGTRACIVCDMLSPKLFDSFLRVKGEAGEMKVINPYHPHWFHWLTIRTPKGTQRGTVRGGNVYTLQLRAFAEAIHGERILNTDPNDAMNNMRLIDAIYEKAGLSLRGAS